jgi:hypothetical protein
MSFKLPHWAQVALGLVVIVIGWTMQQASSGQLVLPAAVLSGLALLNTIIGILSPSASNSTNIKAGDAAKLDKIADAAVRS